MERTSLRQVLRIGLVVSALAALGEGGHLLFGRLGWATGHHAFHLLYGVGAVIVFLGYAIRDVREHGFPSFRWSLGADARIDPDGGPIER